MLGGSHRLGALGVRNSARKRGRSLAVIVIMAAGVFMICVTNAFRLDAEQNPDVRSAGTGGFRFVGESSLKIYDDLNTPEARETYGLDDDELDYSMVPFQVREGEEASCLNLNQAQRPRLMAVDPQQLVERNAFTFQSMLGQVTKGSSPWSLLDRFDLQLADVASVDDVPADGKSSVIVAKVGPDPHIRILNGQGEVIVDKPGAS